MQVDVLFRLYLKLIGRESVSAAYAAELFEVSLRTAYRYFDALSLAGVPVMSRRGAGGGYFLAEEYKINTMYFTQEEYSRIVGALKSIGALVPGENVALDKMLAMAKQSGRDALAAGGIIIDGTGWGNTGSQAKKLSVLSVAREERRVVVFDYGAPGDESLRRAVEPHVFVFKEGNWYMYAYCRRRLEFRTFRLSRINRVATKAETFERREVDAAAAPWSRSFKQTAETVILRLAFDERARAEIEDWLGEDCISGNTAEAQVYRSRMLAARLLSFGSSVKILEPASLAREVCACAKAVLEKY